MRGSRSSGELDDIRPGSSSFGLWASSSSSFLPFLTPPTRILQLSGLQSPSKERALATSNLLRRLFLSLFALFLPKAGA
ncbi:hypothetical protein TgHK011_006331 [Trichoderma gracile]|nr:hypothetical protein TgHK011_006331 [Trichoderma gracile]